jgi:hypothetical protein
MDTEDSSTADLNLKLLQGVSSVQSRPRRAQLEPFDMSKLQFRDMPLIVRLTSAASLLAVWVLFEQIVIEPFGIYRYMPLYRYGRFCTYDAAAVLLVVIYWIVAHRSIDSGPGQVA